LQEGLSRLRGLEAPAHPSSSPGFLDASARGRSAARENYFFLVGFLVVAFFFAGIVFFSFALDFTALALLPGFFFAGIQFLL
jgi:hypothetical protein